MKKISIFACGWLGTPLAQCFINDGFSVKGSTTSENKIEALRARKIEPFLLTLEDVSQNISDFLDSEILIVNIPSKNTVGFKNLIAKVEVSTIQKLIFVSSTSVFENSPEIITEKTILKECPLKEIEQLFQSSAHFETTILRFAGLLGYNRRPGNWFKSGQPIPNPEGVVNMIHQDDCVEIIKQIILQNCWGETFNAAADTHPTRRDFYTQAFLRVGRSLPIFNEHDENDENDEHDEHDENKLKIIENKKVKRILNFHFKYPDLMKLPK